ncbi:hypothetical protein [Bradyrhizobium roseum]|uniref:hypothetical protein n=1 Tax=Bradyrhizobium roseum TaxID=3056648 RepID=UPI0026172F35|nr:hypothetical protein [Bradyrhizobium roseus]WKA29111.1 hypothetical protein QUH67_02625 [Bradyrhizobium roseus]
MEKQIAYIRNKMIGLIAIIAIVSAWQWDFIHEGVMAHVWTTGSILSAFAFSIIMAFIFVHKLKNEVIAFNALKEMWDDIRMGPVEQKADPLWRHYRCSRPGRMFKRPRLLGHAYDLVTEELARTKKIRISVETMNTLVHKIGSTIDDEKSLLGYMSGLLVFMGLIGTFIGLLHMVGSMGGIIGTLASSAGGSGGSTDAFQQLLGALQEPLKGMASGFAASLFGLFSSLVVGLLARFAGQAAGVLKHEFESWLAGVVQIGDEEDQEANAPQRAVTAETVRVESLVRTVGDILADYAKVAANFEQTVRVLGDLQRGQLHQGKIIDSVAQSMSRIGAGIEALTEGVSKNIATELAATRAMVHELERTHNGNLRMLATNHAQTATQIAAVVEQNAVIAERMPAQLSANIEARIDRAVKDAVGPMGLTVADQMEKLQQTFSESGGYGESAGAAANVGHLENQISEGFERLNQNVGAAFSAYSGVLKMAVAALDKTEPGLEEHVPEAAAAHAGPQALAH